MTEFQVTYRKFAGAAKEYLFVEANNAEDCKVLAYDWIKRNGGEISCSVAAIIERSPLPAGRIIA